MVQSESEIPVVDASSQYGSAVYPWSMANMYSNMPALDAVHSSSTVLKPVSSCLVKSTSGKPSLPISTDISSLASTCITSTTVSNLSPSMGTQLPGFYSAGHSSISLTGLSTPQLSTSYNPISTHYRVASSIALPSSSINTSLPTSTMHSMSTPHSTLSSLGYTPGSTSHGFYTGPPHVPISTMPRMGTPYGAQPYPYYAVNHIGNSIKMKNMDLPTFNGDRKSWPEYKNIWKSVVEPQYTSIDALALQFKRSVKGGEAKKIIKNLWITHPGAYKLLWERVCKHYDDPS